MGKQPTVVWKNIWQTSLLEWTSEERLTKEKGKGTGHQSVRKRDMDSHSPELGKRMTCSWLSWWCLLWSCAQAVLPTLVDLRWPRPASALSLPPSGAWWLGSGGCSSPNPSRRRCLNQSNTTSRGSSSPWQAWVRVWVHRSNRAQERTVEGPVCMVQISSVYRRLWSMKIEVEKCFEFE